MATPWKKITKCVDGYTFDVEIPSACGNCGNSVCADRVSSHVATSAFSRVDCSSCGVMLVNAVTNADKLLDVLPPEQNTQSPELKSTVNNEKACVKCGSLDTDAVWDALFIRMCLSCYGEMRLTQLNAVCAVAPPPPKPKRACGRCEFFTDEKKVLLRTQESTVDGLPVFMETKKGDCLRYPEPKMKHRDSWCGEFRERESE